MAAGHDDVSAAAAAPSPSGEPDRIGVALGSVATGATAGAALVTLGIVALRQELAETLPLVLFAGIVTAAATAWWRSGALRPDAWRRGVVSALAVFGGLMLAFLSAPVDRLAGRGGLAFYAILLLVGAVWAGHYALRRGTRA